jgi:PleD family two-component response regulator
MSVRFYETALREVVSGLARLTRSAPDTIDHVVSQMSMIADIAADAGRGAISSAAQDAQAAVQSFASAEVGARSASVEALGRLGQRLLADLCSEVSKTDGAGSVAQEKHRVLVVDDSRVATTALLGAFRNRNFSARASVTLEEVLIELVLFTPEILVSDVFMPDLDVELLAQVFHSVTRGKSSLLVLVSGSTGEPLTARLKNIKHDVFVSKLEGAVKVVDKVVAIWGVGNAPAASQGERSAG